MDFLGIIRFETLNGTKVLKFGRGRGCDVRIENPAVSLHHLTIWSVQFDPTTPPVLYVNDNSRNGVVFNGQEMQRGETRMVKDGDELEIKTAALLTYEALSLDPITPSYTHHNTDATVGKWQITPIKIGCGSFGSVYVARLSGSLKSFAVKVLHPKIPDLTLSNSRSNREYNLLNGIKHPNIITVHEAITTKAATYIFQDLICGGDLFSYLVDENYLKAVPEKEAIFIVFQIMKGLQFLHKKLQIVHRDLKLDNILMQIPLPKTKIYICDFGIAKQLEKSRTNTCVGTVEYSAPEVFRANEKGQSDSPYNFKCDTWSLGIITHIVLSGISPFYSDRKEVILKNARDGRLDFQRKQFSKISTYAKDFVAALLNIDVGCRLDIDECFEHCWIKSNRAKLEKFYREKIENIL